MIKVIAFDVGSTLTKNIFFLNKKVFNLSLFLKQKYKVGIISNTDRFFSKLPINQYVYSNFDKNLVILSYEVKSKKPEKNIYEIFLKKTGCANDEHLFVDNRKKNVFAAKKIGMKGIVFVNFEQLIKEMAKIGIVLPSHPAV